MIIIDKSLSKKFSDIERAQRVYLDPALPLVIRMDGKGVTRDHEVYHLIPCAEWRGPFFEAAKQTVEHYGSELRGTGSAVIFCGMDEINIIYSRGSDFLGLFDDTNAIYAAVMFLQEFTRRLRRMKGRETDFGISIFSIQPGQEEEYLSLRAAYVRKSALDYIAKVCNLGWSDEPDVMKGIYSLAERRAEKETKKEPGFLEGLSDAVVFGNGYSV